MTNAESGSVADGRKVLVTGGDGFVGEHLLAHLLERGDRVTASALSLPPTRDTLSPEQMGAVEWKVADVLDDDALFRLVAAVRPDDIYHLAGFSSGAEALEAAAAAVRTNVEGTVNLFEAILAAREDFPDLAPRVLVMGSGDAYGASARDADRLGEDAPLRPLSPYGLSKACQETVAHTYRRAHGLRVVCARAFHLVGPGQKPGFVVPDFCAQVHAIASGKADPVVRVGNLEVERDFLAVEDGVAALRGMLTLESSRPVYNVCSGRALPVGRLLEWILDEAGVEARVETDEERRREGETPRVAGDPGRLIEDAGWTPVREVEAAVRATYRWLAGGRS